MIPYRVIYDNHSSFETVLVADEDHPVPEGSGSFIVTCEHDLADDVRRFFCHSASGSRIVEAKSMVILARVFKAYDHDHH